ncbi:hypothetical protein [Nocardia stercoris]|uniref:Uncharacterized protein n=1 Tax=Nocardia stercoris TaxID=2483361 RepID=A0A3M2LB15_9NOCA|nr:hypothetical protein [Nocardia stercoris]RMI31818.1 hypothetical protein EBN03_16700 [Nocardia stercoris]
MNSARTELVLGLDTKVTLLVTGLLFLWALALGVWKYRQIRTSPDGSAHVYVDIAHRAALMYSFAGVLLAVFVALSDWPTAVNLTAALIVEALFAGAVAQYCLHGLRRDTTNQFHGTVSPALRFAMYALIAGEFGGFGVPFTGFLHAQFG